VKKPGSPKRSIPSYAADGTRLRKDFSEEAVEHLLALSLVVVRRSPRGRIQCALWRGETGAHPLRATAHLGTRYHRLRRVSETSLKIYELRDLLGERDSDVAKLSPVERAQRDLFLRRVFREVPLSVMAAA
jgi:hypothetical protein